jgi:hypothetical protein
MGIILRPPADFLQIYRWEGADDATLEWMNRPVALQSGETMECAFRMDVVTGVTDAAFTARVAKRD